MEKCISNFIKLDRQHLLEPRKVEKIQEIYLEALRAYVEYLHPVRPGKWITNRFNKREQ